MNSAAYLLSTKLGTRSIFEASIALPPPPCLQVILSPERMQAQARTVTPLCLRRLMLLALFHATRQSPVMVQAMDEAVASAHRSAHLHRAAAVLSPHQIAFRLPFRP